MRLNAGTASSLGAFGQPQSHRVEGVAVAPNGDVWVTDTGWNRLLEYSSTGVFLQQFGGTGSAHGKFNEPAHLEILP